jgi:hypothetical protein
MKRQLAFILARTQVPLEWLQPPSVGDAEIATDEELSDDLECLYNTKLSTHFRDFGKDRGDLPIPSLTALPRHTPKLYIQPYWQGWVRAFRVVSRTQTTPASDEPSLEGNDKEGNGDRKLGERYEWRERWVVIHDGVINISQSPKVRLFSFFFFIQPTHSIYRIQIQCVFLSPP